MSPSLISRLGVCFTLLALILTATPATAQTNYYWNQPGGGSGNWDTTSTLWSTADNVTPNVTWLNDGSATAIFDSGTGTVTLTESISAAGLSFTSGPYTINRAVAGPILTLMNAGTIDVGSSLSATISAPIAGTVGLTKMGAGTLTLSGTNTYSGVTNINAGTVVITATAGLGDTNSGTVVASGASLTIGNSGLNIPAGETLTLSGTGVADEGALRKIGAQNSSWAGAITLGSATRINSDTTGVFTISGAIGGAAQNLTVGGAGNTTITGVIGTGSGQLIKDGAGTLIVGGTSGVANTYTGGTVINGGLLQINAELSSTAGANSTLGVVPSSASANNVQISNGGTLRNTRSGTAGSSFLATNRGITIGTGGGILDVSDTTVANTFLIYAGTITQGANSLTKTGAAILALAGTTTGTGPIFINQGTLRLRTSGERISNSSAVTVASGATFDLSNAGLNGFTETIGSIAGAGDITLGTTGRLIAGGDNSSTTFSGVISGANTTGGITKAGTGTLTLSGANTYTGATTVSAGTLRIGDSGTTGSIVGDVINNATLGFNRSNAYTYGGAISGTGAVEHVGSGTTTLTGNNTYAGNTTVNAGTLLANGQSGTDSGTGTGPVTVNNTGTLGGNGRAAGAVTVNGGGRVLAGTGTAAGQTLSLGSNLTVANTGGIKTVVGNGGTFNDTNTTGSSLVAVTGTFNRDATTSLINIDLISDGSAFTLDTTYTRRVLTYGTLGSNLTAQSYTNGDGVFALNAFGFTISSGWQVLVGDGGNWVDVQFTPVPEPATVMGVAAAGLGAIGLVRRRLRRREVSLAA